MAITVNLMDTGHAGSASSFGTGSFTQNSSNYYLAIGLQEGNSGVAALNRPTVTGFSAIVNAGDPPALRDVFNVQVLGRVGSGATGSITFDFAGQNQLFFNWQIIELVGINTVGTVVQSPTNSASSGAPTVTLSAFGDAVNNLGLFIAADYGGAITTPSGFTLISNATGDTAFHTSYKLGQTLTITAGNDPGDDFAAIGLEIKAAGGGGGGSAKERRTLSDLGSRIGSRQIQF